MMPPAPGVTRPQAEGSLRILIVRVGAMGDVIHALPAAAMLRETLPDAHIGWAIEPRWAPLLRAGDATTRNADHMPLVDAVHLVEAKRWNRRPLSVTTARSIASLRRELRSARYDIAIDLQGTLRSAVIARMSGARILIGSDSPREAFARRLYRTVVPRRASHVVDQAMELASAAIRAANSHAHDAKPSASAAALLPRDAGAEAEWQKRREVMCDAQPLVLLAATAGWGAKEWPPASFAALAAALVDRGYCVLLNTGPDRVDSVTLEVSRLLRERYPEQSRAVHTLQATLPLLIAATRNVDAVIAGDTGPLHVAEALGRPTVGLFGPTDPGRTGPRHNSVCLRDPSSRTDHTRHSHTEEGLARISVAAVLEAFDDLIRS